MTTFYINIAIWNCIVVERRKNKTSKLISYCSYLSYYIIKSCKSDNKIYFKYPAVEIFDIRHLKYYFFTEKKFLYEWYINVCIGGLDVIESDFMINIKNCKYKVRKRIVRREEIKKNYVKE